MRPLTAAEKADNRELKRLSAKIARRDAKRLAQKGGTQAKRAIKAGIRAAGKLTGIAKRRLKRMKEKKS